MLTQGCEQTTDDAISFYNEKVKELQKSLKDLEGVLQQKSNNLRMIEDGTLIDSIHCYSACIQGHLFIVQA